MFDGEFVGLQAIMATKTVTVPHPHKVFSLCCYNTYWYICIGFTRTR